jgi:uncharacterized protein YjiS (DUF1127 family)
MTRTGSFRQNRLAYLDTHSPLPTLAALAVMVAVTVTKWSQRRKTRARLRDLPDHLIRDIGLDREQARHEAALPFWRD